MNAPADTDLLLAIVISAGLGALVGLLRQWTDWSEDHRDINFGGARTFALWGMLGCVGGAAADQFGPAVLVALLALVAAHEIAAMVRLARRRAGATSFAAAMLTMMTGAMVAGGRWDAAIVTAAVTTIVVGSKRPVRDWTRAFTPEDIRAALQFLAVTGVILPIVPNRAYGPYGAFNPYSTWLMVVLISAIGFAAYIVMRWLGEHAGILLASFFGGLASSTATTLAFSRRSRDDPELSAQCAVGIVIACTVMFVRVGVIVAFFSRPLALALMVPFAVMAAPALVFAGIAWYLHRREQLVGTPAVENPLNLGTALKFGALYALIAFLVTVVRKSGWQAGILPLSFVSGLTNMDAITLSLARGAPGAGAAERTAQALVIAAVGNTVLKAVVALVLGSPLVRRWVAVALGWMIVTGVAMLFWQGN